MELPGAALSVCVMKQSHLHVFESILPPLFAVEIARGCFCFVFSVYLFGKVYGSVIVCWCFDGLQNGIKKLQTIHLNVTSFSEGKHQFGCLTLQDVRVLCIQKCGGVCSAS